MVKGKTPKKSKKSRRLGVRKNKKSKNDAKTKRDRRKMPNRIARDAEMSITLSLPGFNEEDTVQEAIRQSPDMTKLLEENDGELYVPPDYLEEEGVAVAASAQPKKRADVQKFMGKLKKEYGLPLTGEHVAASREYRLSSRPPTPIVSFDKYIHDIRRQDNANNEVIDFLNMKTGSEIPIYKGGGKRKSRRRKKSRRRRKKSRRRRTKRKSRRRRK